MRVSKQAKREVAVWVFELSPPYILHCACHISFTTPKSRRHTNKQSEKSPFELRASGFSLGEKLKTMNAMIYHARTPRTFALAFVYTRIVLFCTPKSQQQPFAELPATHKKSHAAVDGRERWRNGKKWKRENNKCGGQLKRAPSAPVKQSAIFQRRCHFPIANAASVWPNGAIFRVANGADLSVAEEWFRRTREGGWGAAGGSSARARRVTASQWEGVSPRPGSPSSPLSPP